MASSGRAPGPASARRDLAWWAQVAAVVPFVASAVVAATRVWYPVSDWALLEIHTADVGTLSPPLVGAYSRFGFGHPGPLQAWLAAPAYLLGGRLPIALALAAAAISGLSVWATVGIGRRRGGAALAVPLALTLGGFALAGLGPSTLVDPWNPFVGFFPFVYVGFACWDLAGGAVRRLPAIAAAGSYAAQAHLQYALPIAALVVTALVVTVGGTRRPRRTSTGGGAVDRVRWREPGLLAVTVLVVCWSLPIVQQVIGARGNLAALADRAVHPTGSRAEVFGVGPAIGQVVGAVVGQGLTAAGDRQGSSRTTDGVGLPIAVVVLLVAAVGAGIAIAMARPRRRAPAVDDEPEDGGAPAAGGPAGSRREPGRAGSPGWRGLAVLGAGALGIVLGLAAISGPAYEWLLLPRWAVPLWFGPLLAWRLLDGASASASVGASRRVAARVGAGALVVVAGAGVVAAPSVRLPHEPWSAAVGTVCEPLADWAAASGATDVAVQSRGNADLYFVTFGCMATMARRGVPFSSTFGGGTVLQGHGPPQPVPDGAARVVVVTGATDIGQPPKGTVLVEWRPSPVEAQAGVPPIRVEVL